MNKTAHIFIGWGIAGSVLLGALVGLPLLAGASSEIKAQDSWRVRAENLRYISADYYNNSGYAKQLANKYAGGAVNPFQADYKITYDLSNAVGEKLGRAKDFSRQINCLAEAVYYEARSEGIEGQKAVAEVVLNRVKSKHFPNTVCEVVYQGAERTTGCQFSFACDGSTARLPYGKHWQRSKDIAAHMMIFDDYNLTNRATHYHTTDVNPKWARHLRRLRQYDTHVFYRFMPRKRQLRPVSVAP